MPRHVEYGLDRLVEALMISRLLKANENMAEAFFFFSRVVVSLKNGN